MYESSAGLYFQIYRVNNETRDWIMMETRHAHSGVHVLVFHQQRFTILQQQLFLTWQPAAHLMFVRMLENIQDHRLILFIGVVSLLCKSVH